MTHAVNILQSAQRQVAKIDPQEWDRVIAAICSLANSPRLAGSRKLSGRPAWRVRVGAYCVICEIYDASSAILVFVVGYRGEVYRRR